MKKILLIEDDQVMRENTAEILDLAGYQVEAAENGKKGVQKLQEFRPDLVICDIMMPELDGYGVLQRLSKDPKTAVIPFIFLTAKAEKSELRKGMDLGADDYLTKPFEEAELLNAIESRLRKNERIRKEFSRTLEGLNEFLDEAKGVADLRLLSQKSPSLQLKKKEMIYHEQDAPHCLYFIHKGKVKTFKTHGDGKEYVTNLYKPGDFFGFTPLMTGSSYEDSAVALEDCELCKIPKDEFSDLLYKNRDVASQFIKMISNDVIEREKQLLSMAYDTVRKRVADALLLLSKRYPGKPGQKARVTVTRDDLAGLAGTATETVIRTLSEFKAEGLVEVEGREIVLLDPEGLAEAE